MNTDLIQQLKKLRAIEPDTMFVAHSRSAVLNYKKPSPRFVFTTPHFIGTAFAFAVFMLLIISFIQRSSPVLSSSLNPKNLSEEFENLSINIQLTEIKYNQTMNQTIASALTEISDTRTRHLNSSLLESEKDALESPNDYNNDIDVLLDRVLF